MHRVVRGSRDLVRTRNVLRWQPMSHYKAPREAGFGKVLIVLSPLAIGGGIVTYAKYDEGFRKTLVANVPQLEPALDFFLKDEPIIAKKLEETKDSVMGLFASKDTPAKKADDVPPPLVKRKVEPVIVKEPEEKAKPKPVINAVPMPEATPPPAAATATKAAPAAPKVTPQKVEKAADPTPKPAVVATPTPVAVKPQPVVAAKPVEPTKLDSEVQVFLNVALGEYQKAIRVLKLYNDDVKKIVDGSIEKVEEIPWVQLKNKTTARDHAVAAAEKAAHDAGQKLDLLEKSLGTKTGPIESEEAARAKKEISLFKQQLNAAKIDMFKAKELSDMSETYWRKVEAARSYFVQEIETLFPDFNVTDKKPKLSKEELDLFTMYAYSHVLAYQKELQKMQVEGEARLRRALDNLKSEDAPNLEAQLEYHLEKEKRGLMLENQKKLLRMREEGESRIRETLRNQAEAHVDHLNEALKLKELEMRRVFERDLDEKLIKEQNSYKAQLAAYLGKLRGMESALKARADADKSAHQSQALWAACQSLWSGVKNGSPGKSWKESLRPLNSEIKAVAKAADGDAFVKTVLESVPQAALDRGVFPEEALRERFVKVDQLARRLAMVKEDRVKLPMFILSYVQSMFILTPANAISKEELKDDIIDFEKLDTYDILNRARYWMDRGNLTQTLKYMNLLRGAPRKVAQDWLNEARLLLETQQIVNTLMAHAASSGLLYL